MFKFLLLLKCALISVVAGIREDWNYVNIRPNAYMFWWLYYTNISEDYFNHPLIIWMQGGPGVNSVGKGNFGQIGPLDLNLQPRAETWLTRANLLFIDTPVGAGYSYVTDDSAYASTDKQVAIDLVTTLSAILQTSPEFQHSPLYIFGQSYGGKIAALFAVELTQAIKANAISCNFKGIGLGSPFISPLDTVSTYTQFLHAMSWIDEIAAESLNVYAKKIRNAVSHKQYEYATDLYLEFQTTILDYTDGMDLSNVLKHTGPVPATNSVRKCDMFDISFDSLTELMNGKVKEKLKIIPQNLTWKSLSIDAFTALKKDFMKPVIQSVDLILNEANIDVNVYAAQLDHVVNALGTEKWTKKLKWPGMKKFNEAERIPINFSHNRTTGFVKSFENFNFFWMLKAGHNLPADSPVSSLRMLDTILSKNG